MNPDRLSRSAEALVDLVAKLRGPGGCPWDAKQTDSTIMLYLLEEAYEVLDAIERSSPADVCQELGDLLFHILFLARLAEERNEFDFIEVVERITEKMIHRHPHVFGRMSVDSAEEVSENWARLKREEKEVSGDTTSLVNDIPMNLPALLLAHRLSERVSKAFDDSPGPGEAWNAVLEHFEGVKKAVSSQDRDLFGQEMGACLFCLVDLARHWGLNSEHLLRTSIREFKERFENK